MFLQSSPALLAPLQFDLVFDFSRNKPSDFVFSVRNFLTVHVAAESKTVYMWSISNLANHIHEVVVLSPCVTRPNNNKIP